METNEDINIESATLKKAEALFSNSSTNNRLLILTTIIAAAILTIIFVGFFINQYHNNKADSVLPPTENDPVSKIATSTEDILMARNLLPIQNSPTNINLADSDIKTDTTKEIESTQPKDNTNNIQNTTNNTSSEIISNEPSRSGDTGRDTIVNSYNVDAGKAEVSGNDDTVKITGAIVVKKEFDDSQLVSTSKSGIIHNIDKTTGVLRVNYANEPALFVTIDNNTTFFIGTTEVTISALKTNDIIKINGLGHPDSNNIKADTITVIGFYEPPEEGVDL